MSIICASFHSTGVNNPGAQDTETESVEQAMEDFDVNDSVIINVGGVRHETLHATLKLAVGSKLSHLKDFQKHYRADRKEYFFDRHPGVFTAILNYCRTGELHLPTDLCAPLIKRELDYWEIDEEEIADCCWLNYCMLKDKTRNLSKFDSVNSSYETCPVSCKNPDVKEQGKWRRRLWTILDDPNSCRIAQIFGIINVCAILLSIFTFCAETHPAFQQEMTIEHYADFYGVPAHVLKSDWEDSDYDKNTSDSMTNHSGDGGNGTYRGKKYERHLSLRVPVNFIMYMDLVCNIYFTLELLARLICCNKKARFFKCFLNIADILALLPFYVELVVHQVNTKEIYSETFLDFISILLIMRIFRIFRLVRHYAGLRVLVYTISSSYKELILVIVFLAIGVLFFSTLVYFSDIHHKTFKSIPGGFWWAIVTMTTVGYGDVVPESDLGQLVGSFCAVCGVLLIAFTVPIIVNNFVLYYTYVQQKGYRKSRSKLKIVREAQRDRSKNPTPDVATVTPNGDFEKYRMKAWTTNVN